MEEKKRKRVVTKKYNKTKQKMLLKSFRLTEEQKAFVEDKGGSVFIRTLIKKAMGD